MEVDPKCVELYDQMKMKHTVRYVVYKAHAWLDLELILVFPNSADTTEWTPTWLSRYPMWKHLV